MGRPRILFVTSRFPYPVIGGGMVRVFNLIRQLQRHFHVSLLSLGNPSDEQLSGLRVTSGVQEITCIAHSRWQSFLGSARALLVGQPLQVGYFRSERLDRAVRDQLATVDIAIFHLIRTSSSYPNCADTPAVLEMCDAISANFYQTAREVKWWSPWWAVSSIEAPRTAAFERHEVDRMALVSIHTRKDANVVGIPPHKLLISTQGVDVAGVKYVSPKHRSGQSIALIGKMDFFPNWSSAEWFGRNVLPLLRNDIRLLIVGDCTPVIRRRLMAIPRVDVTGRVASVADACASCFAAIAPMRVATGIQNKVLEYFAMGLPAVISPSVASGLLPDAEEAYLVADDLKDWAEKIYYLASDVEGAARMAARARDYVYHRHSWDQIGDEYCAHLMALFPPRSVHSVQAAISK